MRPERNERERGAGRSFHSEVFEGKEWRTEKGRGKKGTDKERGGGKKEEKERKRGKVSSFAFVLLYAKGSRATQNGAFFQERFFSRPAGENLSSEGTRRGKKLFRANFLNFVFSSNGVRFLLNTGNKLPISIYYGYIGLFFKVKTEKNDSL